ncbi:uncharacterized protein Z519_00837 [Cladophialophora bantiana CBS 173.52]|uniref:Uncharacterized protein n=1 Tax=Cladophialophora bantiana (strain ATCC 10958 / CBS 173.52 / CDC B-1940 / NIH 8579) TaxID=1442370 RepID=A0A0D2IR12_CLAB1|nr:uncharacterized protein Z519_00837 [Cladophialophora bantiana CBS 173.52]KIW99174.1 hypothetical protein Z519_00837 [Cladophialophora bantiana CBS 173.52]
MPSQGSQILSQLSPLCLPLLKFSYATVSNESIAPIPWIHLSSKDALFAIFETSPIQLEDGRAEERQKFKVLQDPEVMEELDLNALSVEAHRALIQAPAATAVNVPHVAIIVKVPMIAIKYPMANGQIRRFQIRFSKNEDYYEAMKMLSRANVPTVEAGTFPDHKPQAAPRPAAPSLVAPSDSASQVGLSIMGPRNYDDMSALSLSRPAAAAQSAMPPPQMFLAPAQPAQCPSRVRPLADGDSRSAYVSDLGPRYPKSNISLSTATTLVPEKQQPRFRATQPRPRPEDGVDVHSRQSTRVCQQHLGFQAPRGETGLGLRGGQLVPQTTIAEVNDQSCSMPSGGDADSASEKGRKYRQPTSVEANNSEPTTTATAKGRGKRGVANKAAKTPAVKRPRTAATRKKTATKKSQEDKRVPTVDELLQQPGYSLLPDGAITKPRSFSRAQNNLAESDQTKGLEIAETEYDVDQPPAQGSACLGGTATRHITRSASRVLSSVPIQRAAGDDRHVYKTAPPPCTPADQTITNALTPASPVAQAHTTAALAQPMCLSHSGEPEATPDSQAQTPPLPVTDDVLLGLAQKCLSADPAFDLCSARSRLEAWLSLPEPTQATALRTYFCELIMTDGFSQLCRSVDLFWEGAILEGRMMTMTTAATELSAGIEADQEDV